MGFFDFLKRAKILQEEPQTTSSYNVYKKRQENEALINAQITKQDLVPFKGKPFSLSGRLFFDCGIPYLIPTETDQKILERDIECLINKIIATGVFKKYQVGECVSYAQIRPLIYTSTMKIKKFPISVYVNDGITFYVLSYTQNGDLEKAELTYTPNHSTGYTIKFKKYHDGIDVRRICTYSIGGGRISELYCKE